MAMELRASAEQRQRLAAEPLGQRACRLGFA
jgi:hypothetical protein